MEQQDRQRFAFFMIMVAAALLAYTYFFQPQQKPPPPPPPPQQAPGPGTGTDPARPERPQASPQDIGGEKEPVLAVTVRTSEMNVRLGSVGAGIERLELLKHHPSAAEQDQPLVLLDCDMLTRTAPSRPVPRKRSLVLNGFREGLDFEDWNWKLTAIDGQPPGGDPPAEIDATARARTLSFVARRGDIEVLKKLTFSPKGFDVGLDVTVTSRGAEATRVEYRVVGAAGLLLDEPPSTFSYITAMLAVRANSRAGAKTLNINAAKAPDYVREDKLDNLRLSQQFTEWAAVRGRYFAAILMPENPEEAIQAFAEPLDPVETNKDRANLTAGIKIKDFRAEKDLPVRRSFTLRVGPQLAPDLEAYTYTHTESDGQKRQISRELIASVDFGWSWFAWLARWLLWLLQLCYRVVPNFGLCVVLVTLAVKMALHPLSLRAQRSMQRMQQIQPKIKALQQQFKNDPQKLQQAQMRLWKEEGVNPAGGCLPMFLQMPVFFALYGAIRGAFEFRQAPFLYVSDLSRPDELLALPFWPHQLNLLPILYAGLMLVQQIFMSPPLPKEPQARQQAMMMRFMPLMFFLFIYRMPSAFVLYFTASSIIGLVESWIIKKQLKVQTAAAEATGGGSGNGQKPPAEAAAQAPEPAPPPDPKAFWQAEGEKKLGQGKPRK